MQGDKTKEERDKEALEAYVKKLFNTEYMPPRAQMQIKQMMNDKERKYTYSGILKSLKYWYEIKHGTTEKANGGIGIVPHIYDDAYRYYFAIWQAQQENTKILQEKPSLVSIPQIEIRITPPKKEPMGKKRAYFSFLDDELERKGDE